MYKYLFLLSVLSTLLFAGCGGADRRKGIGSGSVENGEYHHDFLGFSMKIPSGFYQLSCSEIDSLRRESSGVMAEDSKRGREFMEHTDSGSTVILSLFGRSIHDVGDGKFNHNIIVTAQDISGSKTDDPVQYLVAALNVPDMGQAESQQGGIRYVSMGGRDFATAVKNIGIAENPITQEYFCYIKDGYSVTFILSYAEPVQRSELIGIISSASFGK